MKSRQRLPLFIGLAVTAAGLSIGLSHAAGTASLNLSPASGTHEINTTFNVNVNENSSDQVNAVEADISYDPTRLQFVSMDTSASAFDTSYPSSGGNGSIKIARANNSGALTGSRVVANISFKVLGGSGTTSLNFQSSSAIVRSSDASNVWNGSPNGASYILSSPTTPAPEPTPSPAVATNPSPTPQPSPSSSTSNTEHTVPPGTHSSGNLASPGQGTPPNTSTQSETGNSGTKTTDFTPNQSSDVSTRFFVAIKVLNTKGQPVKDAEVSLDNNTVKSDATGVASFVNIPPGSYTAKVHSGNVDSTLKVNVDSHISPRQVQQFQVKFKPVATVVPLSVTVLTIVTAFVIAGYILYRKQFRRFPLSASPLAGVSSPSLIPATPTDVGPLNPNNSTNEQAQPGKVVEPTKKEPSDDS